MFIRNLQGNLKGPFNVALTPRTLILGPNGSHKSGLVLAARLALEGKIEGQGAASDYMLLAPAGTTDLETVATVSTPDGDKKASVRVTGSTSKASRPLWNHDGLPGPVGVVLGDVVRAVLSASPKEQRKLLLQAVSPSSILANARKEVPEVYSRHWDDLVVRAKAEAGAEAAEADVLVTIADLVKGDLKTARAAAKTELEDTRPDVPGEQAQAELAQKIAKVKAAMKACETREAGAERLTQLAQELTQAQAALAASGLPSDEHLSQAGKRLGAVSIIQGWLATKGDQGTCPCCGGDVDAARLAGQRQEIQGGFQKLNALRERKATAIAGRSVETVQAEVAKVEGEIKAANQDYPPQLRASDCSAKLLELEETQRQHDAQVKAREAWDARQGEIVRAKGMVDVYAAIQKTVDRLVAAALTKGVDDFCARGQAALPAGWKLQVQLFDGKRQVCRLGLTKPGSDQLIHHKSLSGAQAALFLAAFLSAYASGVDAQLKLAVVDEVWLDTEHMRALLDGLGRTVGTEGGPTQAIVCAVEYRGEVPEGWSVVKLA